MSRNLPEVPTGPRPWVKRLVSVAIVLHFFAIFTAVTTGSMGSPTMLIDLKNKVTSHYLRLTWLENGYRFYAPEPGSPPVMWFRLGYQDGSFRWVELPDRDDHLLRMPFQREMAVAMVFIGGYIDPTTMTVTPQGRAVLPSYVRHLSQRHARADNPVIEVQVYCLMHRVLEPYMAQQGIKQTDLRLYGFNAFGPFQADGKPTRESAVKIAEDGSPEGVLSCYRSLFAQRKGDDRGYLISQVAQDVIAGRKQGHQFVEELGLPKPVEEWLKKHEELMSDSPGELASRLDQSLLVPLPTPPLPTIQPNSSWLPGGSVPPNPLPGMPPGPASPRPRP
jgi:hypothetical protein